jgi:hypothetical protein
MKMKTMRMLKMNQLIWRTTRADFHEVRIENGRAHRKAVLKPGTPQIQSHIQPLTVEFEDRNFFPRQLQQPEVSINCAGSEALLAVVKKSFTLRDTAPHSPLKINRRFVGTCRLHLQRETISQIERRHIPGNKIFQISIIATCSNGIRFET